MVHSFRSRALYLRGEISGVRLYERFVQLGGCHTHRFHVSSSLWYGRLVTEPVLRVEMAFLVLVTGICWIGCSCVILRTAGTASEPVFRSCLPMKQVVSTGWWSCSVSVRTACTCLRILSSKLLYLRFVIIARFIQGLQLVFL